MKILIAVPTYESIYPDTFRAVYDLDKCGHDVQWDFVRGYDVATARNRIAQTAMDRKADNVLMVDNDVVLPQDALQKLLEAGERVVLGYYAHRGADNRYDGRTCICKLKDASGRDYYNYPRESEYTASEMKELAERGEIKVRVHGGGMGCALIRTDVFRELPYPWYDWVNYADNNRGLLSEDLFFCERCKAAGIPVYTDPRVACGHLFRHIQWPE